MRLANYDGRATIVIEGRAIDVAEASNRSLTKDPMMLSNLAHHGALRAVAAAATPLAWPVLDEAKLRAPVPRPAKGFGVALNYRQHAIETGREMPTEPHLFAKTDNCVCGPFDPIVLPEGLTQVDYEAELVLVFGRTCKGATRHDAWSHLAGVTCGQDISDRAEQRRPPVKQFTVAKSYDTFGPIGPYLVTVDELADPDALELEGRVSGEVVQHSNTSDLIFDVPALVVWLSRYITFQPGDLVWTGTPGGVGETTGRFLRGGDVVETEISGIGCMRNPVVQSGAQSGASGAGT
jgi:2-keto-4-pentenoate hydratase/2-oxohepta-3-ene-1,7-dioic acid hydratase in catechol pathway